jgi:acetoin utilization deacetylase AcuC-like enzyme
MTLYTYDPNHILHTLPAHKDIQDHPESHFRVEAIINEIQRIGLDKKLRGLEAHKDHFTSADWDTIRLVHGNRYIEHLQYMVHQGFGHLDEDTYCTQHSVEVALQGVGALLSVTEKVLTAQATNGMALIRPPGHHARAHTAMGFCLFANVAIATQWARKYLGAERIAIVDFDVHHGNGTQEIFYYDPNVLFMSLHGEPPFWPGSGLVSERGAEEGYGANVNIPLPMGTGDNGYLAAFRNILSPLVNRFKPEVIFLSAGYDAHWLDPLGQMRLSTFGFDRLILEMMSWADQHCNGRFVAALEGGYNLDALAHSATHTLSLLHDPNAPLVDELGRSPEPERDVSDLLGEMQHFLVG